MNKETTVRNFRQTKVAGWGRVCVEFRTMNEDPDRGELIIDYVSVFLQRADLDILATCIRKWLDTGEHT